MAMTNNAKKPSKNPRSATNKNSFHGGVLFSIHRDSASGNAAPIANRKNGKTRSTHEMPGSVPIHSNFGGGSGAGYIHEGSAFWSNGNWPDKSMARMASPRSASSARTRL